MDTPYLASMMIVFVNPVFQPHSPLFGSPKNLFSIHSFIGSVSELKNWYWLETELFFNSNIPLETPYNDSKSETRLSYFETFPESNMF